jgi:UDP-2,3-diacylglucosamine pyrophosphatase LpxH
LKKTTLIISDLHVGAGPLDDCDAELESQLVSFIDQVCVRTAPVELIINGDFLDFAQAPPWSGTQLESITPLGIPLCFTEKQSVAKVEAIVKQHSAIFDGLERFVATNPENTLVINPGNHDADFFWPEVRAMFLQEICDVGRANSTQVFFNLAQVYIPPGTNIWIEHGNNYDPANQFHVDEFDPTVGSYAGPRLYWHERNPPILTDKKGEQRLYECLGTRFMIQFLNSLDSQFPFVDNVKPFRKFLKVFGVSALVKGHGPLRATLSVWRMLRYLSTNLATDPGGLLETEKDPGMDPAALLLREKVKTMSDARTRNFHKSLRARGFNLERSALALLQDRELCVPLLMFLADNLDLIDTLFPDATYLGEDGEADGYLTLAKQINIDETKELTNAARSIAHENEVDLIVMGHTHEPVRDEELAYFNTGSWTRNYDLGTNKLRSWEILRSGSEKYFPYELNYVEICDQARPRMETFAKTS